jgi:hypothetical protein
MSGEMNSQTLSGQIQNTERRAERSLDICSNSEVNRIRKEVKDKMETNMRRKVLYFFMGFVLFALLSGWAIGAEQTPKEMPKVLNLATHPIGTMLNSIGWSGHRTE